MREPAAATPVLREPPAGAESRPQRSVQTWRRIAPRETSVPPVYPRAPDTSGRMSCAHGESLLEGVLARMVSSLVTSCHPNPTSMSPAHGPVNASQDRTGNSLNSSVPSLVGRGHFQLRGN
jgi:hypothetical protein